MKLPADIDRISLGHGFEASGFYPPLGFYPFSECELGNGDTFGLYWPFGREPEEPIVAEVRHDEWRLVPGYSKLGAFLGAAAQSLEEEEYPEPPSLDDDPRSPLACLAAAQEELRAQRVEPAVGLLERAVAVLPEYTEALSALGAQYIRLGMHEEACEVAVRAIISPPCFGARPTKLLRWLASQKDAPPSLVHDPVWALRGGLRLVFGGTRENPDYPQLLEAIERYVEQYELVKAILLMQTYGELMSAETVAFQERYGFKPAELKMRQVELSARLPGGPRKLEF
jgi:tetratricopeptide (TPR) repeat protein